MVKNQINKIITKELLLSETQKEKTHKITHNKMQVTQLLQPTLLILLHNNNKKNKNWKMDKMILKKKQKSLSVKSKSV